MSESVRGLPRSPSGNCIPFAKWRLDGPGQESHVVRVICTTSSVCRRGESDLNFKPRTNSTQKLSPLTLSKFAVLMKKHCLHRVFRPTAREVLSSCLMLTRIKTQLWYNSRRCTMRSSILRTKTLIQLLILLHQSEVN